MKYYDLVYFFSGEKNVKISDALVINEILITVVRFQYIGPYHTLFFFRYSLNPMKLQSRICCSYIQLFRERLSEKVHATIRKGIRGGLSSLFFKEICKNGTRGHGLMFAIAKGKQQR